MRDGFRDTDFVVLFDGYVPRQEPPAFFAGGKAVHFDRVEWTVQPDPATAAAALQKNEADWLEQPLMDLIPMLSKSPGVYTKIIEPGGWMMFMVLNHLNPPFDNLKVRQAIMLALDQQSFVESVVGDQHDLAIVPTGLFAPTMPMSNTAGLEKLAAPRDLADQYSLYGTIHESGAFFYDHQRAAALGVGRIYAAAVCADDFVDDRQTQSSPAAAAFTPLRPSREALEQPSAVFAR